MPGLAGPMGQEIGWRDSDPSAPRLDHPRQRMDLEESFGYCGTPVSPHRSDQVPARGLETKQLTEPPGEKAEAGFRAPSRAEPRRSSPTPSNGKHRECAC